MTHTSVIVANLTKSMNEELLAARRYRERAKVAAKYGDTVTAKLHLHVVSEEMTHYREYAARRKRILGR